MNKDLVEGLEKFFTQWLELQTTSAPRSADEFRQAFLDELGERIDQFDSDQDWDEIFANCKDNQEVNFLGT